MTHETIWLSPVQPSPPFFMFLVYRPSVSYVHLLLSLQPPSMEAFARLHHRHQPPYFSVEPFGPSLPRSISLFLSPPSTPSASPSIRASPLPSPSSSDLPLQNPQNPENLSFQFLEPLLRITSFASVTAASALLFIGFRGNQLISKPMELSSVDSIKESVEEMSEVEQVLGKDPFHVQSIRHLKLNEKVAIVHDFTTQKPDDKAWKVLKAEVFSCSEELESVKIGFEEILEKDPYCNKAYHDRILEYLDMVDECKGLLKDIKLAMERCERENRDLKYYLTFFNNVVDRIRTLEGDMVGALKYYQELEQQ